MIIPVLSIDVALKTLSHALTIYDSGTCELDILHLSVIDVFENSDFNKSESKNKSKSKKVVKISHSEKIHCVLTVLIDLWKSISTLVTEDIIIQIENQPANSKEMRCIMDVIFTFYSIKKLDGDNIKNVVLVSSSTKTSGLIFNYLKTGIIFDIIDDDKHIIFNTMKECEYHSNKTLCTDDCSVNSEESKESDVSNASDVSDVSVHDIVFNDDSLMSHKISKAHHKKCELAHYICNNSLKITKNYAFRKKYSVFLLELLICSKQINISSKELLNIVFEKAKKKDDIADAFLYCIYYYLNNKCNFMMEDI